MAQKNSVTVRMDTANWSPMAQQALAGAAGTDPTYSMDDLAKEIQSGQATLYAVKADGAMVGFLVLWIDDFGSERELVWQAGKALGSDKDAVKMVGPLLNQFAKTRGCGFIRSHAQGSEQVRLLRSIGFKRAEIVMRKAVL